MSKYPNTDAPNPFETTWDDWDYLTDTVFGYEQPVSVHNDKRLSDWWSQFKSERVTGLLYEAKLENQPYRALLFTVRAYGRVAESFQSEDMATLEEDLIVRMLYLNSLPPIEDPIIYG